ncbi:MAG: hypothetical protein J0I49_01630 [Pseudonocardia sp.]|uniref:hypothetical protein n=1 Tax=Pseudonocardia sp. TaxID=60912 RepID=UPI001AC65669|nr:hypothetical protein [Pseudonocardia sp.]MBN9096808.1 hypothetical protein [Pseudonocardia sp.]
MTGRERGGVGTVQWKAEPDEHDYPAAASYLSLVGTAAQGTDLVKRLAGAPVEHHKAKDILRSAALPLLAQHNPHVAADLKKVTKGKPLSPVLLVRGDLLRGVPAQIADGYHRVCASYHLDENTGIPCRIVDPLPMTGDRTGPWTGDGR